MQGVHAWERYFPWIGAGPGPFERYFPWIGAGPGPFERYFPWIGAALSHHASCAANAPQQKTSSAPRAKPHARLWLDYKLWLCPVLLCKAHLRADALVGSTYALLLNPQRCLCNCPQEMKHCTICTLYNNSSSKEQIPCVAHWACTFGVLRSTALQLLSFCTRGG